MNIKISGILVCTLLITTATLPVFGSMVSYKIIEEENQEIINVKTINSI